MIQEHFKILPTRYRQDISNTVSSTTERSRNDILNLVHEESQLQSDAAARASASDM
jgi:hypothetical protein